VKLGKKGVIMNNELDLKTIEEKWNTFVDERDWRQFHSPKNLATSVSIEASELLELFLWITPEESRNAMSDPILAGRIKEEVADVFLNLLYLANTLGIDLFDVMLKKIVVNIEQYPVEKSKGIAKKYGS